MVAKGKAPARDLERLQCGVVGPALAERADQLVLMARDGDWQPEATETAVANKLKSVKRWWASARGW